MGSSSYGWELWLVSVVQRRRGVWAGARRGLVVRDGPAWFEQFWFPFPLLSYLQLRSFIASHVHSHSRIYSILHNAPRTVTMDLTTTLDRIATFGEHSLRNSKRCIHRHSVHLITLLALSASPQIWRPYSFKLRHPQTATTADMIRTVTHQTDGVYPGPTAVAPPAGSVGGGWIAEDGGNSASGGGEGVDRDSEMGAGYDTLAMAISDEVPGATAL